MESSKSDKYPNHYSNTNGNGVSRNGLQQPEAEDQNDPFDPKEILNALWAGKWIIAACVIAAGIIGYYYTQSLEDEFQTSSIFIIESQRADRGLNLFEFTQSRSLTWNETGTEMEYIRNSTELGERVGQRLLNDIYNPATGDTLPILKRAGLGRIPESNVVSRLGRILPGMIRLSQVRDMNLVQISARSTDPYEVASVLNYYVEEYARIDEDITRSNLNSAVAYLRELESESTLTLEEQDRKIRDFMEQDWSLMTDQEGTAAARELRQLFRQTEEIQFEHELISDYLGGLRDEKQEVIEMLADGVGSGVEGWLGLLERSILDLEMQAEIFYIEQPELRNSPEQSAELTGITQRLDYLRERKEEKIAVQSQNLREMQGLNEAALTTYLTELRREIRENEAILVDLGKRLAFMESKVTELQKDIVEVMGQSAELQRMRRNMEISEQLYVSLLQRLQQTQIAIRSEVSRVREIRPAFVPGSPVSPNRQRNYILSLLFGAGLGIVIVLLRKFLDDQIHDPEQLRKAGFNVIGVVPDLSDYIKMHFKNTPFIPVQGRQVDVNMVPLIDPIAAGSEAYRRLRTNVEFSHVDHELKTLVITSSKPAEGKSLTAVNLGLTFAQYGKRTLVLDCDLRKPTLHKKFSLEKAPGVSDILFEKSSFDEAVVDTGIDNFHIVPSGSSIPNPAEAMGSERMEKFLKSLKSDYDIIIVDTPPLLVVSDAIPLAVQADATMLVSRAELTELEILKETRRDLREIGVEIVGTILNGFDFTKGQSYYKYNYKYNYAYKDHKLDYQSKEG